MKRKVIALLLSIGVLAFPGSDATAAEYEDLPKPRIEGGRPLMEVLRDRRSTRELRPDPIDRRQMANLLWAAFGVNRPETGQRTAPCTMNLRCVDIYLATRDGAYRYDADSHRLEVVSRDDVRTLTGGQDYVKIAPVALVYVADHAKLARVEAEEREFYAAVDSGLIGQNVYLYCASESLGCVIHMPGDQTALAEALGLRPDQHIVLAHSVGHPENPR